MLIITKTAIDSNDIQFKKHNVYRRTDDVKQNVYIIIVQ